MSGETKPSGSSVKFVTQGQGYRKPRSHFDSWGTELKVKLDHEGQGTKVGQDQDPSTCVHLGNRR